MGASNIFNGSEFYLLTAGCLCLYVLHLPCLAVAPSMSIKAQTVILVQLRQKPIGRSLINLLAKRHKHHETVGGWWWMKSGYTKRSSLTLCCIAFYFQHLFHLPSQITTHSYTVINLLFTHHKNRHCAYVMHAPPFGSIGLASFNILSLILLWFLFYVFLWSCVFESFLSVLLLF